MTERADVSQTTDEKEHNLDAIVSAPAQVSAPKPVLLDLDEYISRFTKRYNSEINFKESVHKYLNLSRKREFVIGFTRVFSKSRYNKQKEELITAYATKIRSQTEEAIKIYEQGVTLQVSTKDYAEKSEELSEHQKTLDQTQAALAEAERNLAEETRAAEYETEQTIESAKTGAHKKKLEIKSQKDAQRIAVETIKKYILDKGLITQAGSGALSFDESKLMASLEDLFLSEIVKGIESESGRGFLSRLKTEYDGLIDHWSELEDVSEISNIDFVDTIIYSRTKGYRVPVFPYFITGKPSQDKKETHGRAVVNSATSVDTSGSMERGKRMELAKKTALAHNALMRKLNPNNIRVLSHYSDEVRQIESSEFFKSVKPDGSTRTDLALDWIYRSLEGKGPGIGYLITDGVPTCSENDLVAQCKKFQDNDNIMLRIFLVMDEATNANEKDMAEKVLKMIGKAAGPRTKYIPVTATGLGKGVIKETSISIRGMYDAA